MSYWLYNICDLLYTHLWHRRIWGRKLRQRHYRKTIIQDANLLALRLVTMKYRLWNKTTQNWIRNDEYRICEFDSPGEALEAMERVKDLQQVNPEHRNDDIVISHTPL